MTKDDLLDDRKASPERRYFLKTYGWKWVWKDTKEPVIKPASAPAVAG